MSGFFSCLNMMMLFLRGYMVVYNDNRYTVRALHEQIYCSSLEQSSETITSSKYLSFIATESYAKLIEKRLPENRKFFSTQKK